MAYELLSVFGNLLLVGITAIYAYDTHRMIKLSRNAQEVMYIQTRLEKLYYPLKNCLSKCQITTANPYVNPSQDEVDYFKMTLYPIIFHLYLASDNLSPLLNHFIGIFYKNGAMIMRKTVEELEEMKRAANLSEEEIGKIEFDQASLKSLPTHSFEKTTASEFQEAADLYPKLLETIDEDIEYYRNRLNKLTTSSKAEN